MQEEETNLHTKWLKSVKNYNGILNTQISQQKTQRSQDHLAQLENLDLLVVGTEEIFLVLAQQQQTFLMVA